MSTKVLLPPQSLSPQFEMLSLGCATRPSSCQSKANSPRSSPFKTGDNAKSVLQCKDCASTRTITSKDLVQRLKKSKLILLDCRPFIAYNLNHIVGALNISCCDRFTKRKLERGKASVGDLVSGHEDAKTIFKDYIKEAEIILYDDSTTDVADIPATHPLYLVLSSLLKEGKEAFVLRGKP